MILTDREIRIAIDRGLIVVDPRPEDRAIASSSIDLTLDAPLSLHKMETPGLDVVVDPANSVFDHEAVLVELTEQVMITADGFELLPRRLALAWTREFIDLKFDTRLAGRVEGKSSLARLGSGVHVTAPTIHAGFKGRIRLELLNHGSRPIRLRLGMRICQLIFEQTFGTPDHGYQGRFLGQTITRRG